MFLKVYLSLNLLVSFSLLCKTEDYRPDAEKLPYCHRQSENLDGLIYVSTLDGRVTALNANDNGSMLWSIRTGDTEMLSSTIQNRELTNSGHWVRMIPSLSGHLYKFDGETIDLVPVSADELLKSSFRYSDDLVFAGGKETLTYGVGLETGRIIYTCDIKGCQNDTESANLAGNEDVLIIQKRQQTVHAIAPDSGQERWNFSVGQHDIRVARTSECHNQKLHCKFNIQAVLPEGKIFATLNNDLVWQQILDSPIVDIWQWKNGDLKQVDVFRGSQWTWSHTENFPSIYVGMHKKQLYIQESEALQTLASFHATNYKRPLIDNKPIPRIPWKPYPVASSAATAILDGNYTKEGNELVEIQTTSLAVLYASKYINGNGFLLYTENKITCDKSNKTKNDFVFEEDEDTPVQIIIVSIWFWWREITAIAIATAFVVNFILAQRFYNRCDINEGVKQEIIIVERHIQIPMIEDSKEISSRHSSESTFNGEFMSRFLTDFDIIRCLGKGGFGMVFEARNKIDECHYAVKCISLPNRVESRERVIREVKALAKLDHRNIVRYYNAWLELPPSDWQLDSIVNSCILDVPVSPFETEDTEESISIASPALPESCAESDDDDDSYIVFDNKSSDNSIEFKSNSVSKKSKNLMVPKQSSNYPRMYLYIQMQLCQKESLKDWMCKNSDRDHLYINTIFEQILSAVEYVHLQGLIHRDLKPSNIFFSLDGQIKIGDFGLVTAMIDEDEANNCDRNKTETGFKKHTREVGTQLYMSPEQVKGSFYNYKVDIYSLGVIYFELLIPFDTEMERYRCLSDLRSNLYPPKFSENYEHEHELLTLMLAKKPELRPTTMGIRAHPPFNHITEDDKWHFELPPRNK